MKLKINKPDISKITINYNWILPDLMVGIINQTVKVLAVEAIICPTSTPILITPSQGPSLPWAAPGSTSKEIPHEPEAVNYYKDKLMKKIEDLRYKNWHPTHLWVCTSQDPQTCWERSSWIQSNPGKYFSGLRVWACQRSKLALGSKTSTARRIYLNWKTWVGCLRWSSSTNLSWAI